MLDLRYHGGGREFYETKALAERAREEKLIEVKNHGAAALALSPEDRVEFIRAKERLTGLGAKLAEVIDFFERHHKTFTPIKLEDAVEKMHQAKLDTNKRERSAMQFFYTLEAFRKSLGDGKLVSQVAREDIEKWLFNPEWKPSTKRTKLIDLQTFFRGAHARGWSTHVPTDGIERMELDDKPPGILTVEQCERLLRAAEKHRPHFCGFLSLALFCGIRPDEACHMRAGDVNIDAGFAEVRAEVSKTRKRRLVDLAENAKAWIKIGLAFTNPRGNMNAIRKAAGFQGFTRKRIDGRETWITTPGEPWPHDCLRHSFGSYHVAMHGSADKTATQMGHRSTEMLFRHYRALVPRAEAERFWSIWPVENNR